MLFVSEAAAKALVLVCHQNNEGISLYKRGMFAEAVLRLKEGMLASKTCLEQCLEEVENTAVVKIFMSLPVLPSQAVQSPEIRFFIDSSVYSKAFEIEMNLLGRCESSFQQPMIQEEGGLSLFLSRFNSFLIFNFALAHHALAMSSRGKNDKVSQNNLYSKARKLYSLAYKSLQREHGQKVIDPFFMLHLLVQAILNNLGQCYMSLDERENSLACFKLLLQSIILFQQDRSRTCNFGSPDSGNFDDQHIDFFLQNTLFLVLKDPGFAPAA
ncbi:hypothetical protein IV203_024390 [Nitzschia inconspicua]|uniref:Uncharacterized protein n=1 Tax=Nitzschia inconspicua TaxID=303405 RepID=A0A9K3KBT1_9STRA|nr:hypothetical protein IV203_024390 [Nitzschia inconspicua]